MEAIVPDIKLARIPDRKPVKLVVEMLPDLEQARFKARSKPAEGPVLI